MRRLLYLALVVALLLPATFAFDPPAVVEAQSGRQVWAFYMGFWTGDGWAASNNVLIDRPARGTYDSRDPGVMGAQIDEARSAGIDAFVVSWFGTGDQVVTTAVLNNALDRAAERGFQVGAAVDVFVPDFNRSRQAMVDAIRYLVNDRANHPAYLRLDGKPVIFFAFQERSGFSDADWAAIRNEVDPGRNTVWIAEGLNGCCTHAGTFDGMYAFNVAWSANPASTAAQQAARTRSAGGSIYIPTVHPGWNEDLVAAQQGRTNPTPVQERANGQFLINSWNGAINAGSNVVLVVSWNEFAENNHIEPSQVYGTQSLDILRGLTGAWKGGAAAAPAAAPAAVPAQTTTTTTQTTTTVPGAVIATINTATLNVRSAPSTAGTRITQVNRGEQYQIVGRNADNSWWLLALPNGQGWVFARLTTWTGDASQVPVSDAQGGVGAAPAPVTTTTTTTTTAPAAPTGVTATSTVNLRVRSGPGTNFSQVNRLPWQAQAQIVGRNAANTWVQISYNGVTGWVAAQYVTITGDLGAVPVTG